MHRLHPKSHPDKKEVVMIAGLTSAQRLLANKLLQVGAISIIAPRPKARRQDWRVAFNLQTVDHPVRPGPLTPEIMQMVRAEFAKAFEGKMWEYDRTAVMGGLENPFADQFENIIGRHDLRLTLRRNESNHLTGGISGKSKESGNQVLLIDDYMDELGTKHEAVNVLENAGFTVATILVFIDRGNIALSDLRHEGYSVKAIMTLADMIRHYYSSGKITQEEYDSLKNNF